MNPRDLDNFNYMMSLNEAEFDEWLLTISNDDVNYAMELIQVRREELAMAELGLSDEVGDFTEALAVINRIKAL